MLYIALAVVWCLFAFVAMAICRSARASDDAHAVALADWLTRGGRWRIERSRADALVLERLSEIDPEVRRATG